MMLKIFYLVIMVKASFLTYLYIYVSALWKKITVNVLVDDVNGRRTADGYDSG